MYRNEIRKYPLIFFAVNLIGIAAALMLESGFGCDPIGLLCDGISRALNIKYGTGCFIYNITVIAGSLAVSRKELGAGTVLYGLASGFFIDFYQAVFSRFGLAERGAGMAVTAFIIGELCMSLAFALLMQLNLGMTALDAVLMKLEKITHTRYLFLKTASDILMITAGILLGGVFGPGTIFSALVTGTLTSQLGKLIGNVQGKRVKGEAKRVKCEKVQWNFYRE